MRPSCPGEGEVDTWMWRVRAKAYSAHERDKGIGGERMKIFGEPWDAPACEDAERVSTPVGEDCLLCGEPVEEGDRGVVLPHGSAGGWEDRPEHAECFLRSMAGPPAHVHGTCSYRGGTAEDSGMSYREEAQETWRLLMGAGR